MRYLNECRKQFTLRSWRLTSSSSRRCSQTGRWERSPCPLATVDIASRCACHQERVEEQQQLSKTAEFAQARRHCPRVVSTPPFEHFVLWASFLCVYRPAIRRIERAARRARARCRGARRGSCRPSRRARTACGCRGRVRGSASQGQGSLLARISRGEAPPMYPTRSKLFFTVAIAGCRADDV